MADTISVSTTANDRYNLYFGDDLTSQFDSFVQKYSSRKAILVVDEFIVAHHQQLFKKVLSKNFPELHLFEVPSGESSKSHAVYKKLLDFILEKGVERNTPLIAIGGGVTGDLAGFAAATVLRGIPLIHMPTTLLAMVDSSIGGKTGINHSTGKNLVGSFYQPEAVFADTRFLNTLPKKEWVNGLSEVLKYGMIHSPEILSEVQSLLNQDIFTDGKAWLPLIKKSAQIKVDIVSEDVLESGKRAYLNFGHTFAHVIERKGNYEKYSHGEAVFAGMAGAVYASNKLGANIEISNLMQFKPLYNFSLAQFQPDISEMVELMKRDKKVKDEQVQLILLHKPGEPYSYIADDLTIANEAWQFILNTFE